NRYAYARGNPVTLSDPGGRRAEGTVLDELFAKQTELLGAAIGGEDVSGELETVGIEIGAEVGRIEHEAAVAAARQAKRIDNSRGLGSAFTAIRGLGPAARTNAPGGLTSPVPRSGGETRSLIVDAGAVGVDAVVLGTLGVVAAPVVLEGGAAASATATAASQNIVAQAIATVAVAQQQASNAVAANPATGELAHRLAGSPVAAAVGAGSLGILEAEAVQQGIPPGATLVPALGSRAAKGGGKVGAEAAREISLKGKNLNEL